jgi:hypothetical protein
MNTMKAMMVVAAFALAIGSAQADAPNYNIHHVTLQDERVSIPAGA